MDVDQAINMTVGEVVAFVAGCLAQDGPTDGPTGGR
jgi:hypothetical protein